MTKIRNKEIAERIVSSGDLRPGDVIRAHLFGNSKAQHAVVVDAHTGPLGNTRYVLLLSSQDAFMINADQMSGIVLLEIGRTELFIAGGLSPRNHYHVLVRAKDGSLHYYAGCRHFLSRAQCVKHWGKHHPSAQNRDWERDAVARLWGYAKQRGWVLPEPKQVPKRANRRVRS